MRRNALLFVLISLLSGFGSTAMTLSAGLWILDLTGSVGLAALSGVCIYAPTYAAPWLGALVDRLPRRPLLISTDLLLTAVLLSLFAVRSPSEVWLIFVVLLARGVNYVVQDAGETAILPSALPVESLGRVNGWRTSAQEGMKLLAPLAGAGLFAWRGPEPVVLVCAAMPLLSAACYAALRLPGTSRPVRINAARSPGEAPDGARSGVAGDGDEAAGGLRAGLAVLFRDSAVRVPVLVAAVAIALSGFCSAAVLHRVVHGFHLPATHLGILGAAQGAGSIAGGLIVGRLLARLAPTGTAALGAALFAGGCVAQCLPFWPAMMAGSVLIGFGLPWTLVAAVTAVQTETPDHLLGRAGATASTVMFGPVALTIPLGSALVSFGGRPPLLLAAVVALIAAVAATVHGRRAPKRPGAVPPPELSELTIE